MSIFDKLRSWLGGKPPADANAPADAADAPPPLPPPAPPARAPGPPRAPPAHPRATPDEARPRARRREDAALEAEARGLLDGDDAEAAVGFLRARHVALLARHEATSLPCLCHACLRPDVKTAESAGIPYVRDFVVRDHRALFYWMPRELAPHAPQVRASMRAELRERLRAQRRREDEARPGVNPFTNEPITIGPKRRSPRINPFTGRRFS
jgi:hypothetical protein